MIVALFLSLWVQTAAMADGLGAADAAAKQGALFGIVQGSAMLWAPFFGWLADKIDRVTLVILATLLSIVGYGWMGFTPDPAASAAAFGAAAMLGIGQASGILASQVLIAQEAPGPIRGAVIGMVGFFGAVGILLISKVGGWAFDAWRPGAPFIIMAVAPMRRCWCLRSTCASPRCSGGEPESPPHERPACRRPHADGATVLAALPVCDLRAGSAASPPLRRSTNPAAGPTSGAPPAAGHRASGRRRGAGEHGPECRHRPSRLRHLSPRDYRRPAAVAALSASSCWCIPMARGPW